jgi:hypothetical protein
MDAFEFFVDGPPLSQQTKKPARLREWKEYVKNEAARLWDREAPFDGSLKLTVVYYHERDSVLIDHDNMVNLYRMRLPDWFTTMIDRSRIRRHGRQALTEDSACGIFRPHTPVRLLKEKNSFTSGLKRRPITRNCYDEFDVNRT